MRNKVQKSRCVKSSLDKFEDVVKTYDALQEATAKVLSEDNNYAVIKCNVDCCTIDGIAYTTDFLCRKNNGTYEVYECVYRKHLAKPKTMKLLDASQKFWGARGVIWKLVIDKE